MSAPSVVTKNNHAATIQIGQAVALPRHPDLTPADTEKKEMDFVETGVWLEITPTMKGGQIFLAGKATVRTPDQSSSAGVLQRIPLTAPDDEGDESAPVILGAMSFNTVESYFSAPVKPGSTLLLHCRQDEKQKGSLLITITATIAEDVAVPKGQGAPN